VAKFFRDAYTYYEHMMVAEIGTRRNMLRAASMSAMASNAPSATLSDLSVGFVHDAYFASHVAGGDGRTAY
jgi:hypothetical protein